MKRLIIFGAIGTCLDIAEAALASGYEVLGFLDDGLPQGHTTPLGLPVLGGRADASRFPEACFINGIGSPGSYQRKPGFVAELGLPLARFAIVIHPTAVVSATAVVEPGCAVFSHCSLGVGVRVRAHTIMLQNCVIGHDTDIGEHTSFAAGVSVSGNVTIGKNCYLGAGAAIRNSVRIGDGALVGLGAAVVSDVPAHEVWYGNPARRGR